MSSDQTKIPGLSTRTGPVFLFLQRGDVARLDVAGADVALCRQLIYHRGTWITPAMQAMIDLICQENEGEPRLSTEA